jgi:glycosyltransferase involved in cell wall biosynthesis
MNSDKVSVILTVRDEGQSLKELLNTLESQSRQADEIVIIDGGSTEWRLGLL